MSSCFNTKFASFLDFVIQTLPWNVYRICVNKTPLLIKPPLLENSNTPPLFWVKIRKISIAHHLKTPDIFISRRCLIDVDMACKTKLTNVIEGLHFCRLLNHFFFHSALLYWCTLFLSPFLQSFFSHRPIIQKKRNLGKSNSSLANNRHFFRNRILLLSSYSYITLFFISSPLCFCCYNEKEILPK